MRKLVWCGAVLVVGGAVAVYMAANYANKHPNSLVGRCAAAAATVGTHCNPFIYAATVGPAHVVQTVGEGACTQGHLEKCAGPKPVPAVEPEPREVREAAEPAELVEPIRPEVAIEEPEDRENIERRSMGLGAGRIDSVDLLPGGPLQEAPAESSEPRPVTRPEAETAEELEIYADSELDLTMPIAVASEEVEIIPAPTVTETDYESIPAPAEEASDAEESAVEQTDSGTICHTGCCGWLHQVMKFFGMCPENPAGTDSTPTDENTPQSEGTESPNSTPPSAYPHGCPHMNMGCPYMGCPYPYSRPAPTPAPATTEQPEKAREEKAPEQESSWLSGIWEKLFATSECVAPAGDSSLCPVNNLGETPRKKKLSGRFLYEEAPRQTGIDTMEFRPTDDPRDPPGTHPF